MKLLQSKSLFTKLFQNLTLYEKLNRQWLTYIDALLYYYIIDNKNFVKNPDTPITLIEECKI